MLWLILTLPIKRRTAMSCVTVPSCDTPFLLPAPTRQTCHAMKLPWLDEAARREHVHAEAAEEAAIRSHYVRTTKTNISQKQNHQTTGTPASCLEGMKPYHCTPQSTWELAKTPAFQDETHGSDETYDRLRWAPPEQKLAYPGLSLLLHT